MAASFTDNTGIAVDGRQVYSIHVSAMGAATSISVQFSSDDGTTYTEETTLTAAGWKAFGPEAVTHVKLVGTGGTDYTATLSLAEVN